MDELPAADLLLDVRAGKQRPAEPLFFRHWPVYPDQQYFRHGAGVLHHDQHPGGGRAGHGIQLPPLHDPAHLLCDREDGRQPGGGRQGSGRRVRPGVPEGDPAPEPPRGALRGDHGVRAVGVHLCHLPPAGRRHPDDAGRPHRAAVPGRGL